MRYRVPGKSVVFRKSSLKTHKDIHDRYMLPSGEAVVNSAGVGGELGCGRRGQGEDVV